jgi:hypothetical protein
MAYDQALANVEAERDALQAEADRLKTALFFSEEQVRHLAVERDRLGGGQDPSTDLENVNAAYRWEREENARLMRRVEQLEQEQDKIVGDLVEELEGERARVEQLEQALREIGEGSNGRGDWVWHRVQEALHPDQQGGK